MHGARRRAGSVRPGETEAWQVAPHRSRSVKAAAACTSSSTGWRTTDRVPDEPNGTKRTSRRGTIGGAIPFKVVSDYEPAGYQPAAIERLSEGQGGERFQTLLGITGSGKCATIAWTIEQVQRPTLVLAPNKCLAAQLAHEMKEFFPENRLEYFVSYYDYYQPEAYIPSSHTYIEKDSSINDEIDRLRHSTTAALLTRRDIIVVASVCCIYGLGNPEEYKGSWSSSTPASTTTSARSAQVARRSPVPTRNDMTLGRGKFRVAGAT